MPTSAGSWKKYLSGDFLNPRIKPTPHYVSCIGRGDSLPLSHLGSPCILETQLLESTPELTQHQRYCVWLKVLFALTHSFPPASLGEGARGAGSILQLRSTSEKPSQWLRSGSGGIPESENEATPPASRQPPCREAQMLSVSRCKMPQGTTDQ